MPVSESNVYIAPGGMRRIVASVERLGDGSSCVGEVACVVAVAPGAYGALPPWQGGHAGDAAGTADGFEVVAKRETFERSREMSARSARSVSNCMTMVEKMRYKTPRFSSVPNNVRYVSSFSDALDSANRPSA